jgi:hypothetical protein
VRPGADDGARLGIEADNLSVAAHARGRLRGAVGPQEPDALGVERGRLAVRAGQNERKRVCRADLDGAHRALGEHLGLHLAQLFGVEPERRRDAEPGAIGGGAAADAGREERAEQCEPRRLPPAPGPRSSARARADRYRNRPNRERGQFGRSVGTRFDFDFGPDFDPDSPGPQRRVVET